MKFVEDLNLLKGRKNVILASLSTPTSTGAASLRAFGEFYSVKLGFPFGSLGLSFVRCTPAHLLVEGPFSRLWEEELKQVPAFSQRLNVEVQASFFLGRL